MNMSARRVVAMAAIIGDARGGRHGINDTRGHGRRLRAGPIKSAPPYLLVGLVGPFACAPAGVASDAARPSSLISQVPFCMCCSTRPSPRCWPITGFGFRPATVIGAHYEVDETDPQGLKRRMAVVTAGAPPGMQRYQLDTGLAQMTPAERAARGKEARAAVPRDSHAVFDPPPDRPDPIALLEEQAQSRVPELVPIRWGRMMVSPFTYYRGAALPMASDLATTPVSGLAVQACGDAHLSNFGIFGSAERRLVFDVNDFDETLPGPWEWDVKRLAASLEVAARGNGFPGKDRREIVTATVARYRQAMRTFAGMTNLERLVRARGHGRAAGAVRLAAERAAAQDGGQGPGQGADPGQHAGSGQADPARRRPAADHLRPAADRPDR